MVVELESKDGGLRLSTDGNGWCFVELVVSGRVTLLGAEDQRIVVDRLTNAVASTLEGPWVDGIDGRIAFVMSFSEHHCTIYSYDELERRVLILHDSQGQVVGRLELPPTICRRWNEQLLGLFASGREVPFL